MMSNNWIQKAVKKRGELKIWIKMNYSKIKKLTGLEPLNNDGDINILALKRLVKTDWYKRLRLKTKKRINLAITLNKLRKKK